MDEPVTDSSERLQAIYEQLSEEHRRLMEMVNRIQAARSSEALKAMLEDLHQSLMAHFAHETYPDGFYQAMGACAPEYGSNLRVLVDEHFRILSRLWSIKERIDPEQPDIPPRLSDEIAGLTMMLADHERQEHELATRLLDRAGVGPP
ncbi:MAG: hypothetical protein GWN84_09810 [Gammaproteobacteria bacterium]|nr:hypothetical protein [Gammaproteobacteria bacterium]NIR83160.1 hypothetical protein [Gammaproteobacteria bacterium]NIR90968.1 hypothetical protein [Gammaproteobacteria bacterium]NIU04325.1 hypothetical protein [Gammaproteobacteria bacterium]NIV52548.1 hypothetical protein [Gammaproteobacteria bacterium]